NTMAEQNVPTQPPTRTDEQIIAVDILSNTNFFQAFTASANVPAIYLQQIVAIHEGAVLGRFIKGSADIFSSYKAKPQANYKEKPQEMKRATEQARYTQKAHIPPTQSNNPSQLPHPVNEISKRKPSTEKLGKGKPAFQLVDKDDECSTKLFL
ncbi:hypothetical protein Tco_0749527, partial [Tanacetum coccineum]